MTQADPAILFGIPLLIMLSVSLGYFLTERAWGQAMMMVVGILVTASEVWPYGS